jgi:hypothetical protein
MRVEHLHPLTAQKTVQEIHPPELPVRLQREWQYFHVAWKIWPEEREQLIGAYQQRAKAAAVESA